MTMIYLVLLILASLTFATLGMRAIYTFIKRKYRQLTFRGMKNALFGINPRPGRTTIYSTAPLKEQKMAWRMAQNNEIVAEEIRNYAVAQGVDNSSLYVDTFEIRHSARSNRELTKRVASYLERYSRSVGESAKQAMRRMNRRCIAILQWLSRCAHSIGDGFERLAIIHKKLGGADNNGENHTIR